MPALKTGSETVWAYESCNVGGKTHRDPLCAVSRSLQLKFQDSKITVTNWVESG